MAIYYEDISGTSTSQILNSQLSNQILSGDLFLISQQSISSVNPDRTYQWHNQLLRNNFASRNLSYNSLSNDLFDTLCGEFGFGSMAWESSANYSLGDHVHPYSKIEVESFFSKDGKVSSLAIATVRCNDNKTTIYMPEIKKYNQPKPYLGQLKFIAKASLPVIDCNTLDFDGWVYPDGREVSRSIFPDAYEFFGTDYGEPSDDTVFKIPCLTNFIKIIQPTSSNKDTRLASEVPKNEVLKAHSHGVQQLGMSGIIDSTTMFTSVNNYHDGDACHGRGLTELDVSQTYDIWFKVINLAFNSSFPLQTRSTGNSKTTHPSYNFCPVLIYIGQPNYDN